MNRERLGVLLIEMCDGQVSVQLFENHDKAMEIFRQLSGHDKLRATFISLNWGSGVVFAETKTLPEDKSGERMVGWKLGEGPIFALQPFGIQKS
jgi:hypothetical protein